MKIQFLGAAQEVTGSKHLITLDNGTKILMDCGMYQGKGLATDGMNRKLGFNPSDIDYLLLSHAHIDHSGLIPYIHKEGFHGQILSTPATRDLCAIMFADAAIIQESDTRDFNRKRAKQGLPPVEPLFTGKDAAACMQNFVTVAYGKTFQLCPQVKMRFYDTGHLLGSAAIYLTITENGKDTTVCYTGDVGRYDKLILREPQTFPQADYILCESTYGDRLHTNMTNAEQELLDVTVETCVQKRGKLIIPSFAIGRCQEIVYSFDRLKNKQLLPNIHIYVDSPLAMSATHIFRMHPECLNKELREYMMTDPDPFGFDKLHYVRSKDESKHINDYSTPCVIISASGMMEAGRVKHHLAHNLPNPKNTVLAVGYCAPPTLGAKILRGDKRVSIHGLYYNVNADVRRIESYSAHGDYNELTRYLSCQNPQAVKKLFLVHGEKEAQETFGEHLSGKGFDVTIPKLEDSYTL
ncbi:MAG: MBL fold metallo-hydrolase [Bacteroidales bacterium]|jgi:metallo-beta-lactamase family protein|nr:MBL fold metallo-hydrolase [Bacteroidales bacterium]